MLSDLEKIKPDNRLTQPQGFLRVLFNRKLCFACGGVDIGLLRTRTLTVPPVLLLSI